MTNIHALVVRRCVLHYGLLAQFGRNTGDSGAACPTAQHHGRRFVPGCLLVFPCHRINRDQHGQVPGPDLEHRCRECIAGPRGVRRGYRRPYVARWGSPAKPEQLAAFPFPSGGSLPAVSWVLVNGSPRHEIKYDARVTVSDVSAIHGVAVPGLGAALLPEQLCEDDAARGTLIRLLPGWATRPSTSPPITRVAGWNRRRSTYSWTICSNGWPGLRSCDPSSPRNARFHSAAPSGYMPTSGLPCGAGCGTRSVRSKKRNISSKPEPAAARDRATSTALFAGSR